MQQTSNMGKTKGTGNVGTTQHSGMLGCFHLRHLSHIHII